MTTSILPLALACSCSPRSNRASARASQKGDARTRDVYVSVVDAKGAPVPGLDRGRLRREGGWRRARGPEGRTRRPSRCRSRSSSTTARRRPPPSSRCAKGSTRSSTALKGKGEISLVTIGERPTSLVQLHHATSAAVKKSIDRIFARPGSGAYLTRGHPRRQQGARKAEGRRGR